jgi:hypothetical protein
MDVSQRLLAHHGGLRGAISGGQPRQVLASQRDFL